MVKTQITYSDNGSDKFHEKFGEFEKRGIEMIEEVDEEAFDMRTIVILDKV